ncbi:MAG TPA: hypothetical protein VFU63_12645 [Ktedonobacterales bacterium]|nr:hypothetical protein [Ktedonobacterales bacterium]
MNSVPGNSPVGNGIAPVRGAARTDKYLDLKALRLAVHGWWLGNPLVYKPDDADLGAYTRELADAGAASGTLILGDTYGPNSTSASHDVVRAVLILRPPISQVSGALIGETAAHSVATVAQETFGCSCVVQGQWDVVIRNDASLDDLCHISVEVRDDAAFLRLRLALAPLWAVGQKNGTAALLLARSDWREVLLARVLHTLDIRLQGLLPA